MFEHKEITADRKIFIDKINILDKSFDGNTPFESNAEHKNNNDTYAYYPPSDKRGNNANTSSMEIELIEKIFDKSPLLFQYMKLSKYLLNGKHYPTHNPFAKISVKKSCDNSWSRMELLLDLFLF